MKYRIEELGKATWLIEEYDENSSVYMYLLAGTKEAVLIDAGFGKIPLDEIVAALTPLPVKVLLSHGHYDHIGGAGCFQDIYLHEKDFPTYKLHTAMYRKIFGESDLPDTEVVIPMTERDEFNLGGRVIKVIHTPGHSTGSVCFLDEKNRWLFTGDTCCKAHVLLHLEYSVSVNTYAESVQKVLDMKESFKLTWPGHHTYPVEMPVIEQFREAALGILNKTMQGEDVELMGEKVKLLTYRDIGITYQEELIT